MKELLIVGLAFCLAGFAFSTTTTLFDFKVKSIDGEPVELAQYKGKKVLIVNTASECGYTGQYAGLEELYKKHGGKLVILGFPSNDFGGQEPASNTEIKGFCQKNYGVTFPLFEKVKVTGPDAHPLWQWLSKKEKNGVADAAPKWNFTKYLVNEKGQFVKMFPSKTTPDDKELAEAIGL